MDLIIQHVEVHVSSIEQAKQFYVDQLGLEVLEERPELNLLALKAGSVRVSIFGGFEKSENPGDKKTGTHIIFRTENIEETVKELRDRGTVFTGDVFEAPGFIRGIALMDPDRNVIEIVEYLRDPLAKAG